MAFSSATDLYLSTDDGETFAATNKPAATYSNNDSWLGPDGRLWATWADSAGTGDHVAYSDNYGTNWTNSLTTAHGGSTGEHFYNVRSHSSSTGYILVGGTYIAAGFGSASIYLSTDNGASWGRHDTGSGVQGCFAWWGYGTRIIAALSTSIFADYDIGTSDNLNVSYSDRFAWDGVSNTSARLPSDMIQAGSSTLFGLLNSADTASKVMARSTDSGTSWVSFVRPISGGNNIRANSIAYDSTVDTLYCAADDKTFKCLHPTTADPNDSASWVELPVTGNGSQLDYNDLVILPATSSSSGGGGGNPAVLYQSPFKRRDIERFERPLYERARRNIERI